MSRASRAQRRSIAAPGGRPGARGRSLPIRSLLRSLRPFCSLAIVALAVGSGCGAVDFLNELEEPQLDLARMETDIRSALQRDLERQARTTRASVRSVGRVRCRQRSEFEATCFARVSGGRRKQLRELAVSVDPNTGRYRFERVR